jgi:DNA modification methylase
MIIMKEISSKQNEKGRWPANIIHDGLEEGWSKYFYCTKASKKEKSDTEHPTVKPINLMRYLVKLVTPKDGLVLDPFAGTGTTGEACILEGRNYYLIEKTKKYISDIEKRINKYGRLGV